MRNSFLHATPTSDACQKARIRRSLSLAILAMTLMIGSLVMIGCGGAGKTGVIPIADASRLASRNAEAGASVRVRGVITYWERQSGDCTIQDSSGGLRVSLRKNQAEMSVGEEVEASGLVRASGHAALLMEPSIIRIGNATVQRATAVSLEKDDLSGLINRRISFRGTVESIARGTQFVVRSGRSRAIVHAAGLFGADVSRFDGQELEIEGVLVRLGDKSEIRREMRIWSSGVDSFRIVGKRVSPEDLAVTPVASLLQLSDRQLPERAVRVRGRVTASSGLLRIRDSSGNMAVVLRDGTGSTTDPIADLYGFVNRENDEVMLRNARPVVPRKNADGEIQTALAVHRLSIAEAARHLPIRLHAVVTYSNPELQPLFVQDGTDGIYVVRGARELIPLQAGDRVEITGVTVAGDFAPNIGQASFRILSSGSKSADSMPMPETDLEAIFAGQMDCRWVELSGIVQEVRPEKKGSLVVLAWSNRTFPVHITAPYAEVLPLLDRHVALQGAVGTVFNSRRQVIGIRMYVPALRFVRTLGDAPPQLLSTAPQLIRSLLQFSPGTVLGRRLRVQGIVTVASKTGPTWIRDGSAGMRISSHEMADIKAGDLVDVLGAPKFDGFGAVMSSASIVKIRSGLPDAALRIDPEDALDGSADQQLVRIDGTVVNASVERTDSVATLRSGPWLFVVRVPLTEHGATNLASKLLPGAEVRATGICSVTVDHHVEFSNVSPSGFEILLQSADDLVILKPASWFTLGHVAGVLSAAIVLVVLGAFWIVMLRRHVRKQTSELTVKTGQLEAANEIANHALRGAREAESLEQDRKVILEMVARDEPLEKIMGVLAEAVARHLPEATCSVQLDVPDRNEVARSPSMAEFSAPDLAAISAALAEPEASASTSAKTFASVSGRQPGDHTIRREVAIMRGCQRVGAIVTLWPSVRAVSREQTGILESWGRFAGLAVERRDLYEQLSHRARFDNLTSLYNRASLYEYLESQLARTAVEPEVTAILFLDLDGFKGINDTFGHDTGDIVLQEVARRIRHCIRQTDVAGRVGGDEFVVVLPGLRDRTEAENLGALLVSAIREPIVANGREIYPGASHGISIFPEEGADIEALLKAADEGMYRTKARHKASDGALEGCRVEDAVLTT